MFATGVTMGLAEWIMDDTFLVSYRSACYNKAFSYGCSNLLNKGNRILELKSNRVFSKASFIFQNIGMLC